MIKNRTMKKPRFLSISALFVFSALISAAFLSGCGGNNGTSHATTAATARGAGRYCGNSVLDAGNREQCDDGNTTDGDGCSATCQTETRTQSISAGGDVSCIVKQSGGVKCWGLNFGGQLGDGTTTDSRYPVDVIGLTSGVASVSISNFNACALTTGGGLKCWGDNSFGQIGDGTIIERHTPVDVTGMTSGVASVSVGNMYACAVTTGGGLKCWGINQNGGELGDGTMANRSTPVDVTGLTSGVASVSAGTYHTCAVTTAGGVKCWGVNFNGQLGDGTTIDRHTPVDVAGLTSGVVAVSIGQLHTCALTTGGGVKCWGINTHGQLGDGTTTERHTPVDVTGLTSGVTGLTCGTDTACAKIGGGVKCWGKNSFHELLGDATSNDRTTPADVSGLSAGVTSVSYVGNINGCVLTLNGGVQCWGYNGGIWLGVMTNADYSTPVYIEFGSSCGDSVVWTAAPFSEQCDSGAANGTNGLCTATCQSTGACGNAFIDPGENCDDGNSVSGDECSATCQLECVPNGGACTTDAQCCGHGQAVCFAGTCQN